MCKVGSCTSHFYELKAGVTQAGVLSPILFGIYIDGLVNLVDKTNIGLEVKLKHFALVYFCMLMT